MMASAASILMFEELNEPLLQGARWLMPLLLPSMKGFGVHFQDLGAFFDRQFHFQAPFPYALTNGLGY
jgi:hypothetical protein